MKTRLIIPILALIAAPAVFAKSAPVTLRVEPERKYILRGDSAELVFRIDLRGVSRSTTSLQPLNLAVVLDRSGSMSGAKLERAKQAAGLIVNRLTGNDRFAMIVYDDTVDLLVPSAKVSNPERVHRAIEQIQSGGSTALHAGVQSGADQVREFLRRDHVNRVILLSDGIANVGPKTPSALARLGASLREDGISVTTIGLGDDYNEDLMVALAEASAANYYYVQDAEMLPEIFAEELGNLQSIIAQNLRIRIDMPEEVEAVEVIGHPDVQFRDGCAEITLGELYGAQRRHFLVRCRVRETTQDEQSVGIVRLEYQDAAANLQRTLEDRAVVKTTADGSLVDASTNSEVVVARVTAENVKARQDALAKADAGEVDAAVDKLRDRAAAAIAGAPHDPAIQRQSRQLNKNADLLESRGNFDHQTRKAFQYETYQLKNQKSPR